MSTQKLEDFQLLHESVWVIRLDGQAVGGYGQAGFSSLRSAKSSFNYRLRWQHRQYGFNSAAEMRQALEDSGRLEFIRL